MPLQLPAGGARHRHAADQPPWPAPPASQAGLAGVQAEGRCPVVRGGSPLAADFLRLTIEKLRGPVLAGGAVTGEEFARAMAALQDPDTTVVAPMTVAAWGRRP